MNRLYIIVAMASIMLLYPCLGFAQGKSSIPTQALIKRQNIRILTIGCGRNKNGRNDLNSAQDLVAYERDSIAAKYIWPSYKYHYLNVKLNGKVNVEAFKDTLYNFARDTKQNDVVIIHILGHGETDSDGNYYFICYDGKLEGSYICNQLKKMAGNGALVVIFLDTCEAGALFNNINQYFNYNNGGAIAFYASSKSNQKADEIEQYTRFTKTILSTLKNENSVAFSESTQFLTLGGLKNVINAAFGTNDDSPPEKRQTPQSLFLSEKGKIDGYIIEDYPLIKKVTDGIPFPPTPKTPRYVYAGASGGLNITPTPYTNINIGLDINHRHKIEFGASLAFTQSDDVFIYDKNGILQNGYNYRGWNIYGRYGCNVMPKESRWEIVPLGGFSENFIYGLHGFNSDTGKTASCFMFSASCRFARSICKDKQLLLHGTLGCDFPIKKDGNVDVLKEDKYIKNWCTIGPYVEIGIVAKLFHL
ncbi:caspase family protein [Prevotella sp. E13-27]|uniref:caspase family protein n=1 Tax=Prevotella sp. E13-27 TaxID=2938122 RepID=UPI00200A0DFD|nr:caspase family protein [Prevotella sp. E13-27]MCK8621050.1 caspase family protein [Prevotella sp. E13-27]